MPRATIIVDVPGERQAMEEWFATWSEKMTFISENEGCGCCVDIYNVEGPKEAIDAIPPGLHGNSAWASSKET